MKILISAAETSSDAHGAELLKAIRSQTGATDLQAFGVGGPKLQAAGLRAIVDARELMAMGFTEILGRLPRIFRALDEITEEAQRVQPDVAVVIDYPDFHFRLARRLKKLGIPLVYYIPPKVWVWRKSRVHVLRRFFDQVLCIFPFEEEFYRDQNIPVYYVGNPLIDQLPIQRDVGEKHSGNQGEGRAETLQESRAASLRKAKRALNLNESDPVLILMPGARASELKEHLELMLDAAAAAVPRLREMGFLKPNERLQILMPFPVTASDSSMESLRARVKKRTQSDLIQVHVSQGNAHLCLLAADAGLIKSGTSTLEAGLLLCPHTIVYKTTRTTAWIYKNLIRYRGPVGLVNLVTHWRKDGQYKEEDYLVREIVLGDVTLSALTSEIVSLLTDQKRKAKILKGLELLRKKIFGERLDLSPSQRAAEEILKRVRR